MRTLLAAASCLGFVVLSARSPAATRLPDISTQRQTAVTGRHDDILYTHHNRFDIPFYLSALASEVVLYVSTDNGKTYRQVSSASPDAERFHYQAPRDGMYWFSVQTVNAQGKREPAKVQGLPPELKVCVDTTAPVVQLKASRKGKEVHVEWVARDPNLRTQTMKLEYRVVGEDKWSTLPADQKAKGRYTWTPENAPVEVRLWVNDWAGNLGQETVTVTRKRPGQE